MREYLKFRIFYKCSLVSDGIRKAHLLIKISQHPKENRTRLHMHIYPLVRGVIDCFEEQPGKRLDVGDHTVSHSYTVHGRAYN